MIVAEKEETMKKRKPSTCSACGKKGHRRDTKKCPMYETSKFLREHDGPWNDRVYKD